jgi:hypothetical protein
MKRRALITIAFTLALTACGGDDGKGASSPSPSASRARISSTAVIRIVSPAPGEAVSTSGVTVKIALTGARIVPAASTNNKPDEGHVHLSVDGRVITLTGGLSVDTGPLGAGPHLIEIEFSASDHRPFSPRVIQQVTVTAR